MPGGKPGSKTTSGRKVPENPGKHMQESGVYGEALQARAALVSRSLQKATLAVTELRYDSPNVLSTPPVREDAFVVALFLRDYPVYAGNVNAGGQHDMISGHSLGANRWHVDRRWAVAIPQQAQPRRRIDHWSLKIISVGEGDRYANVVSCMEPVRNRQKIENQFDRFSVW